MSVGCRIRLCNNYAFTGKLVGICGKKNCNFAHRISELEEEECLVSSTENDVYLRREADEYPERVQVFIDYYKYALEKRHHIPLFADIVVSRAYVACVDTTDVLTVRVHDLGYKFFQEGRDKYLVRVLMIVNILRKHRSDILEHFVSNTWSDRELDLYVKTVKMPPAAFVAAEAAARSYQVNYKYHLSVLKYIMRF